MKKNTTKPAQRKTAAPYPASERRKFNREFLDALRTEAARTTFNYRRRAKGTVNPHPIVQSIRAAMDGDTPHLLLYQLEASIHMMVLCAGNLISLDAPLDAQYLAAHQRVNDFHADLLLGTPEELARFGALIHAGLAVRAACAAIEEWQEESAAS